MVGFLFGGNTGLTYQDLQDRRAAADALAKRIMGAQPRNTMEGIGAILTGAAAGIGRHSADKGIKEGRASASEQFNKLFGQITGQTVPDNQANGSLLPKPGAAAELSATEPAKDFSVDPSIKSGIAETASALGISPTDLATAISYETAGTFDPTKAGPTTQWGQHKGLIQFGEPQAAENGVDWNDPVGSQLGADGAVAKYLRSAGVKPGMGLMDIYSAINAGRVGRYDASDANNGGAPGTVADKVNQQMAGHRAKALALFPPETAAATPQAAIEAIAPQAYRDPMVSAPNSQPQSGSMPLPQQQAAAALPPLPSREVGPAPRVAGMPAQAPQQVAQASPFGGIDPQMMQLLNNPFLPEENRQMLQMVIQQQMQSNDPMRKLQMQKLQQELTQPDYDIISGKDGSIFRADKRAGTVEQVYGGKQETFRPLSNEEEQQMGLDPAQAYQIGPDNKVYKIGGEGTTVNIDQRAEGAFDKKLAEKQAEAFDTMASEGINARADIGVINELDALLQGQGGTLTGVSGALAQYGIGGEGIDDLQAAQALINKLVPTQRAPGSGSMSDRDVELFTRSLPSLWNSPGGNAKIIGVMRGLAEYKQGQGEIADQVLTGEMTRQEARRALRALPNPLAEIARPEPSPRAQAEPNVETNAPKTPAEATGLPPVAPADAGDAPAGVPAELWSVMTPEERALWQR